MFHPFASLLTHEPLLSVNIILRNEYNLLALFIVNITKKPLLFYFELDAVGN